MSKSQCYELHTPIKDKVLKILEFDLRFSLQAFHYYLNNLFLALLQATQITKKSNLTRNFFSRKKFLMRNRTLIMPSICFAFGNTVNSNP